MTRFRLDAGRPVTRNGGGSFARPPEPAVEIKRSRVWTPNQEPDTPLKCGCTIPWPTIRLTSVSNYQQGVSRSEKLVRCDQHGWQGITKKEIERAQRAERKERIWYAAQQQLTLDETQSDEPPY